MAFVAGLSLLTACGSDDDNNPDPTPLPSDTPETLQGVITEDVTLESGKTYKLSGQYTVKDGATLTIEPGVTIEAIDDQIIDYILIEQGGKINAQIAKSMFRKYFFQIPHDTGFSIPCFSCKKYQPKLFDISAYKILFRQFHIKSGVQITLIHHIAVRLILSAVFHNFIYIFFQHISDDPSALISYKSLPILYYNFIIKLYVFSNDPCKCSE